MNEATGIQTADGRKRGRLPALPAEARRKLIVERAYEAFMEFGFAGTTIGIIAARARVSRRTIYEHFVGKAELFAAVVLQNRRLLLDLPRPTREDLPMIDKLVKVFRLDMDRKRDVEREALLDLIMRESVLFPELSDFLYEQKILRMREDLIEWLEAECTHGAIAVDDIDVCARMRMDIAFGALIPRRRQQGDEARDGRKQDIRRRFEIFLRGIGGGLRDREA